MCTAHCIDNPTPAACLRDALEQVGLVGDVILQRLDLLLRRRQLSSLLSQRLLLGLQGDGEAKGIEMVLLYHVAMPGKACSKHAPP